MLLNYGAVIRHHSWESLGLQGDQTSQSKRKSTVNIHWKDWCWSWSSNTLATWFEKESHWKRPWCWKRLRKRGEGGDRGWDSWMASLTQWTWVWANSGNSEGQGNLACCSSWGHKSQTWVSNWTTTTEPKSYFLLTNKSLKYIINHENSSSNMLKVPYLIMWLNYL